MRPPRLCLRLTALLLLAASAPLAQEVLEDQDPVDLDWVPAWDTPFWPAPSGAALEIVAGRTGGRTPRAVAGTEHVTSGEYVVALLTLPLGAGPRTRPAFDAVASGGQEAGSDAEVDDGEPPESPERRRRVPAESSATSTVSSEPTGAAPLLPSGPTPEVLEPGLDASKPRARAGEVPLELVRDAMERAETAAGFRATLRRLASVGHRARWSGLAPELRLRGATGIDQTRSIDSAGVVPSDEVLRDGSDSLVEVRLTFHLERLLHSGQEVALERARQQVLTERAEVRALVGHELVVYLRSLRRARDDTLEDEEREKMEFAAESARLSLFLLTDGWFKGEETLLRYEAAGREKARAESLDRP